MNVLADTQPNPMLQPNVPTLNPNELITIDIRDPITCLLCYNLFEEKQIYSAKNCDHKFCNHCLEHYLSTQLAQKQKLIKCPIPHCNQTIPNQDIQKHSNNQFASIEIKTPAQEEYGDPLNIHCTKAGCGQFMKITKVLPNGNTVLTCDCGNVVELSKNGIKELDPMPPKQGNIADKLSSDNIVLNSNVMDSVSHKVIDNKEYRYHEKHHSLNQVEKAVGSVVSCVLTVGFLIPMEIIWIALQLVLAPFLYLGYFIMEIFIIAGLIVRKIYQRLARHKILQVLGTLLGVVLSPVLVILWGVGIALPPTHGPRVVYEIQTENHNLIDEMKMRCFSGKRDFSFYCPLLSGKSQLNLEIGE